MKKLLLFCLCLFTSISFAQPSDGCTGIPTLTVNASCSYTAFSMPGSYTNGADIAASCFGGGNRDAGWYQFTANSTTTAIDFESTTGTNNRRANISVWTACAGGTEVACMDVAANTVGSMNFATTIGVTYYIQVHRTSGNNTRTIAASICVYDFTPPAPIQGDDECNPIVITPGTTCTYTTYDNTGMSSSGTIADPGCASFDPGVTIDIWFALEVPASGNLTFDTQAGGITDAGMAVYTGANCSGLTLVDCDDDGGTGLMSNIVASGLTPGDTAYIRVWEFSDGEGTFDLCVVDNCPTGTPANNEPCNATAITIGGSATNENNSCADGTNDPAAPSCWTAGNSNTLWYSFTAPISGEATIGITNGSLANSQIAVFSGACGSLTEISCSTTATGAGCAGSSTYDTDISLTGLTPATTYYIAVDGQNNDAGTFDIVLLGSTPTVIPGQDCSSPIPICNSVMSIGDPGYSATGNVCDFDGSQDCTGGERNSVWYQIDILASGNLNFSIIPNDGNATSCGTETDYDFVVWRTVSGTGLDPVQDCSTLSTASTAIVACNYDADGVTGVAAGGNSPFDPCFNTAFEPTIAATAGDQYILVVSNFTGSTQGFTLDLTGSGAGVVDYTGSPSDVAWTGGTDTDFEDSDNWGSCATPTCGIGAIVIGGITNQPVLTGTHNVNDITINPGATLTLGAGTVLNVCGDFENNGNLVADPTSTVNFVGSLNNQTISGNLTGVNAFGNLTVNKTSNIVYFNSNIEIAGTFTTSNLTSIIDANDLSITVGGDVNLAGPLTLINVDAGEFIFNGGAAQSYTTNGDLALNNVTINGTQVDMNDNVICDADGILTLSNGIFVTGANRVELNNTASAATGAGSTASYVQGNLRRYITGNTSYDFPVGDATAGYERANITFTDPTTITYLDGRFDSWPGALPGNLGANECIAATYNMDALDNGFWTIDASNTPTSGNYTATLYNTAGSYTNDAGAQGWTVMKNSGAGWILDGTCVITSTVNQVMRTGMNGFSLFATAQNPGSPLPIELISFTGERSNSNNLLRWSTASETSTLRFEIERSFDGIVYSKVGEVGAAGNTLTTESYMFMDFNVNSTAYYRLVLINQDLSSEYFEPIRLDVNGANDVQIYPNPVGNMLTVHADYNNDAVIEVYDLAGRLVLSKTPALKGIGNYGLNLEVLSEGTYVLKFIFDVERTQSIRFVKE